MKCSQKTRWMVVCGLLMSFFATLAWADGDSGDDQGGHERAPYAIGLWGDLPYSDVQALTGVPNLIADMNRQELAFTVHDGDLKAGNGTPGSVTAIAFRAVLANTQTPNWMQRGSTSKSGWCRLYGFAPGVRHPSQASAPGTCSRYRPKSSASPR